MSIVALVSGGLDSLVMCKMLEKEEKDIFPLFIDYGQKAREKEWNACKNILNNSNLPEPVKMDLSGYGQIIKSGLTDPSKDIFREAFTPGRNMLFLVAGASYALQKGANSVAIGLLSEKTHLFGDQTSEFIVNANVAINSALSGSFYILTPLMTFEKGDVMRMGKKFGLPLELTYSCHAGEDHYCGTCISCQEIIAHGGRDILPQFRKGGK